MFLRIMVVLLGLVGISGVGIAFILAQKPAPEQKVAVAPPPVAPPAPKLHILVAARALRAGALLVMEDIGATEVPALRIHHMETPSPYSSFGQKGIGEGGAIGPPAAIANAVNDALRPLGVVVTELPITPARLLAALGR